LIYWMMPERKALVWKHVRLQAVLVPLAVFALWEPVRQVITQNHFNFGGQQGFYENTMTSLVYMVCTGISVDEPLLLFFKTLFTASMGLAVGVILWKATKKDRTFFKERTTFIVCTGVLLLTCIVAIAQHVLVGTDHLVGRFAKFLVPLLMLHLGCSVVVLFQKGGEKLAIVLLLLLAGRSFGVYLYGYDHYDSNEWKYDMETKHMMQVLVDHHARTSTRGTCFRIGNAWVFEPTINFYRVIWRVDDLAPAERTLPAWDEDYLYLHEGLLQDVDTTRYELLQTFTHAGSRLYARRRSVAP
jgi:hypothetical protein